MKKMYLLIAILLVSAKLVSGIMLTESTDLNKANEKTFHPTIQLLTSGKDCIPPNISDQSPAQLSTCPGLTLTLFVTATGTDSTFQWYNSGGIMTGRTSDTLNIITADNYYCIVSGACEPQATSSTITVTLDASPAISVQPAPVSGCSGTGTTFSVVATGATAYQWQSDSSGVYANLTNGGVYSNVRRATMNISSITGLNNTHYRCILSNGTCSVTSDPALLTVTTAPAITAQPASKSACTGSGTYFSVAASGGNLSYQWQLSNFGGNFTNLSNTGVYSGTTKDTLRISNVAGLNNRQYRCIVSGSCSPAVTSNAAILTVANPPTISNQPASISRCDGSNASFSVTTTGGGGLSYQWQSDVSGVFANLSNGGVYSNVTSATMNISNITGLNNTNYRCIISNASCTITSNSATLTFLNTPVIIVQPSPVFACDGSSASFFVTVAGSTLSYRWQSDVSGSYANLNNGGVYSNVTSATMNISNVAGLDNIHYRCIVNNGSCSVTSDPATLTFLASPEITVQPVPLTLCSGNAASFSITATGDTLTYQWQSDASGSFVDLSNGGVYSDVTTTTLNISDNSGLNNINYRCIVSNNSCSVTSNPAKLTVQGSPVITVQPGAVNACTGNNSTFTITATGTNLSYQWQIDNGTGFTDLTNTGVYTGTTTNTLRIANVTGLNSMQYRCIVSGTCLPAATSNSALLTINSAPTITSQPASISRCKGTSASFSLTSPGVSLSYRWQSDASGIYTSLNNGGVYSNVTTATMNISDVTGLNNIHFRCIVSNSSCSISSYQALLTVLISPLITVQPSPVAACEGSNALFTITGTGSNLSYQWQSSPNGNTFTNLNNTVIYSGVTKDSLKISNVTSLNNIQFRCIVSGTCTPAVTSNSVTLTVGSAITITNQPVAASGCGGTNASFSVTATGGTLSYQWESAAAGTQNFVSLQNGGVFSNVRTATLNISNIAGLNNTHYRCIVSNSSCSLTSNPALLTVTASPLITVQPSPVTACAGSSATFSITATGSNLSYQWQQSAFGGNFNNLTNTGVYSGTTTDKLNISNVTGLNNRQYRCTITGSCTPAVTSNAAVLTIGAAPTINTQPVAASSCDGTAASFTVAATGGSLGYQWQSDASGTYANLSSGGVYSNVTSATMNISSVTGLNNTNYRCIVRNASCSVTSNSAILTVLTAPVITLQPSQVNGCAGNNASFTVIAAGSAISYQWQSNSGGTFHNLTNGGVYSNVRTATLNISNVNGLNGIYFQCIVTGCGTSVTTNPVLLIVNNPPSLTLQPKAITICSGNSTYFNVAATGGNISYQWQTNNFGGNFTNLANTGVYSGVTTDSLKISNVTGLNNRQFRCIISGTCTPTVTSNAVTLTVNAVPAISTQPVSVSTCLGNSTLFTLIATGGSLTYQWQSNLNGSFMNLSNGGIYSNVSSDSLKISDVTDLDSTYYRCIVSNQNCSITSNAALLRAIISSAITAQPTPLAACAGSSASFSIKATGGNIEYQWQSDASGTFQNLNNGSTYSNVTTATMNISNVSGLNGIHYQCIVTGCDLSSITSTSVLLSVSTTSPAIITQPRSITTCSVNSTYFVITAAGDNLTYQWQVNNFGFNFTNVTNTGVYTGATKDTLKISNVAGLNARQYRCIVRGTCNPPATSANATLTVNTAPTLAGQPVSVSSCDGLPVVFNVRVGGGGGGAGIIYQWQSAAVGTQNFMSLQNGGIFSNVTTATLNISNNTGLDSTNYRCILSNANCITTSNTALLRVVISPAIITQPINVNACSGGTATFTIVAAGGSLSYQWQSDLSGTFQNLTNSGVYRNVLTRSMNILNVTGLNGTNYRCIVTGCDSSSTTSNSAMLKLGTNAPAIASQPKAVTACTGTNATFTLAATGDNLSYQWQINNFGQNYTNLTNTGVYSDVTTNTLKISNVTGLNNRQYRCIVSGTCTPAVTSVSVILTVNNNPTISIQPLSLLKCTGTNATFFLTASGASTYQWQSAAVGTQNFVSLQNGGVYTNVNTATLNISNVTGLDSTQYRCIVSNSPCSITSNSALLRVLIAPAITMQPKSAVACDGSNVSFTVNAIGGTLSYQWQSNSGGTFQNLSNTGVYTNVNTAKMNISNVAGLDSVSYRCLVSGCDASATTSSPALLTTGTNAPIITAEPVAVTGCVGSSTFFTVTAAGDNLSYQWQLNNVNLTNTGVYSDVNTNTLNISNVTGLNNRKYRCIVSGTCSPAATSNSVILTVTTAPTITKQPVSLTECLGSNASFSITGIGLDLTYQWQSDVSGIYVDLPDTGVYKGATTSTLNISDVTGLDNTHYRCIMNGACSHGTTSNAALLTIETSPAILSQPSPVKVCNGNSALFSLAAAGGALIYQWQSDEGGTFQNLSNGGVYSNVTTSNLNISNATGLNYINFQCIVTSCGMSVTSNSALLIVNSQPVIVIQPKPETACSGTNTYFSVTVTGDNLLYQWQRLNNAGTNYVNMANGGVISGATADTLKISNVAGLNNRQIRCIITGSCLPATTSNTVILTVNPAPAITTQPASSSKCLGTAASFTVVVNPPAGVTYLWQTNVSGSYTNLSNGGIYSNVTSATMNISDVTGLDSTYYRCIVSNLLCSTTSNSALLRAILSPTITLQPRPVAACAGSNTTFSVTATGGTISYQWQSDELGTFQNLSNGGVYTNTDASVMNISNVSGLNGISYQCIVTGCDSLATTSNTALLTVGVNAPSIISQPIAMTICSGSSVYFNIKGMGDNLTYQWQRLRNNGVSFINLTNTGVYAGTTTDSLRISNSAGLNNMQYRCIITGTCSPAATSNTARLTVNTVPAIQTQPLSASGCNGLSVSFSVNVTGAVTGYQWQSDVSGSFANLTNGGIYSNVTAATMNISNNTGLDSTNYRCIVTNLTCNATSNSALLRVLISPAITRQPASVSVCSNSRASFAVTALGSSLTYQWQSDAGGIYQNLINGGVYSNVTTSTLNISNVFGLNGIHYQCIVTGCESSVTSSDPALLTVGTSVPEITEQPKPVITCSGSKTYFTVSVKGDNLSYQWQVNNNGTSFTNITNTGVYSGANSDSLKISNVTGLNNRQYRCIIIGICPPVVISNTASLTVNTNPTVSIQPVSASKCLGSSVSFTVTASGGTLYRWQSDISGTYADLGNGGMYKNVNTATLNISDDTGLDNVNYRCIISNASCSATSNSALLSVMISPVIKAQPKSVAACDGSSASLSVSATGGTLTYQWQSDSSGVFENLNNNAAYNNVTASTMNISNVSGLNGIYYRCIITGCDSAATTSNPALLTIGSVSASIISQPKDDIACSGYSAYFSVEAAGDNLSYQWQVNYTNLLNVGVYSGVNSDTLKISNVAGLNSRQYRCIVSGICTPPVTTTIASLTVNTAPLISRQPVSAVKCTGSNASFSVAVTGNIESFIWQSDISGTYSDLSNSGVFSDVTTSTLNISDVTGLDSIHYRCVITGNCSPAAISNAALLRVLNSPVISVQPKPISICSGSSVAFFVNATGGSLSYQWQSNAGGTYQDLSNGGVYSNVTSSILSISNITGLSGTSYKCIVTGCNSSVTSDSALLTVNTGPVITLQPKSDTLCAGNSTYFVLKGTGDKLTYQWQVNTFGVNFTNLTNTGVYSHVNSDTLKISNVTGLNNRRYRCIVYGTCTPTATSSTAVLTVNTAPAITTQPVQVAQCKGTGTTFSVTATGTALSYIWQSAAVGTQNFVSLQNGGVYSNVSQATMNISDITNLDNIHFRCVVSNANCSIISDPALLIVLTSPEITKQSEPVTICEGSIASLLITSNGTTLRYQWYNDNGLIADATKQTYNTAESGNYYCIINGACAPPATSSKISVTVDAIPLITDQSSQDIHLNMDSTVVLFVTATGTGLTYQWYNTTGVLSGRTSDTLSTGTAGNYYCIVSGTCPPEVTSSTISVTTGPSPRIVNQSPQNMHICEGIAADLFVTATGDGLTYQWYNVSGLMPGKTYDTLKTKLTDQYYCIVKGTYQPPATSKTITLNLDTPPVIESQSSQITHTCEGSLVSLFVKATGTEKAYQWYYETVLMTGRTSDTLNTAKAGNYYCIVNGICNLSVTSLTITLTVDAAPLILSHSSQNRHVCEGSAVSLFVTAKGSGLTYQWYNISGAMAGRTKDTLITKAAGNYYCIVSGTCKPPATSVTITVTLDKAPVILTQSLQNTHICEGVSEPIFITATGTGLNYQWYSESTALTGRISDTLNTGKAGNYYCIVNGTCKPSASSSAITVSLDISPLMIEQSLQNIHVCEGLAKTLYVKATGTDLIYQWYNVEAGIWKPEAGAISDTLITGAAGNYYCIVSGKCSPPVTSSIISITLDTAPVITDQSPLDIHVGCGTSAPSLYVTAKGTGLTYQWYNAYSLISNATNTSYNAPLPNKYYCIVSGKCLQPDTSGTINLTIDIPVSLNIKPILQIKYPGDSLSYSLSPVGTSPFSFQWTKDGLDIAGATDITFNIKSIICGDSGIYSCKIENICNSINVDILKLVVPCLPNYVIAGSVRYNNTQLTPLNNTTIYLKNISNETVDSTITDITGAYIFRNLPSGNYNIVPDIKKPWGGGNPLDAFMINRYYIHIYNFTDNLRKQAADVNFDKKVNPTDALMVNRRYIHVLNKFPSSDWIYENDTLYNFKAICYGDVNGSYIPPARIEYSDFLIQGAMNVKEGEVFNLPLIIGKDAELGAMGLKINYSSANIKVIDVISDIQGLIYNIIQSDESDNRAERAHEHLENNLVVNKSYESSINIAWSAMDNTINLKSGQQFIYLKCIIINKESNLDNLFRLNSESILADNDGKVIDEKLIAIPKLLTMDNNTRFSFTSYPNPFSSKATISYYLPTACKVIITIHDILGKEIQTLVNEEKDKGLYNLIFDAGNLSNGVYFYQITAGSEKAKGKLLLLK